MTKYFSVSMGRPGHHDIPPTEIIVLVMASDMRIPRESMTNKKGIIAVLIESAVGFVRDGHPGERITAMQLKRFVKCHELSVPKWASTSDTVATGKGIVGQFSTHITPGLPAMPDPGRQ